MQINYQWLNILSTTLGVAALVGCTSTSPVPVQNGQISQRYRRAAERELDAAGLAGLFSTNKVIVVKEDPGTE